MLKPGQFQCPPVPVPQSAHRAGLSQPRGRAQRRRRQDSRRLRDEAQQLHTRRGIPALRLRGRADRLSTSVEARRAGRDKRGGIGPLPEILLATDQRGVHDGVQQQPGVDEVPRPPEVDEAGLVERRRLEIPAPVPASTRSPRPSRSGRSGGAPGPRRRRRQSDYG